MDSNTERSPLVLFIGGVVTLFFVAGLVAVLLIGCTADDGSGGSGGLDGGEGMDGGVGLDGSYHVDGDMGYDGWTGGEDGSVDLPSRWLDWEGVVNARDVGGYAISTGETIRWGVLFRGGDLTNLTQAGCDAMELDRVVTVIDLREDATRQNSPAPECVSVNAAIQPVPMPKLLPASEQNYLALMEQAEPVVSGMFNALAAAGAAPVYIHCVIGRDRASYAIALVMLALGADRQAVLEDFRLSNDVGIGVTDSHLEAVLDEIDSRGGIETYLTGLGVTQQEINAVREWALE